MSEFMSDKKMFFDGLAVLLPMRKSKLPHKALTYHLFYNHGEKQKFVTIIFN